MPPIVKVRYRGQPKGRISWATQTELESTMSFPKIRNAFGAFDRHVERIRMYQSFVLFSESHRLPATALKRLGIDG
jgi:hypothetical protein